MKRSIGHDCFDIKLGQEEQDILNDIVIPAYEKHQKGSLKKPIRQEYGADPLVITYAFSLKEDRRLLKLLPVVVTNDKTMRKICTHLGLDYIGWKEFFDEVIYSRLKNMCPDCF